ncbi:hypothetical protein BXY66_0604 [Shimia isoporae]|uniref:Outer membrane beta-barrel porin/alpha-amylase n=1 Tax=Shimia isoporae TaxID=647720 RepID=A0A4R1NJV3_9RHOB|nr:hypothetical protein [Shimia isoporae]TCL08567.1 hypothetical protein BXY66_0604 [Shimia isoporae]
MFRKFALSVAVSCAVISAPAFAQGDDYCDEACQVARKAQDPLAPITAILTDNTISYDASGAARKEFQLQPVHTFEGENANFILRGIIPTVGVKDPVSGKTSYGLGDTMIQAFYVPNSYNGGFKMGYGLQASLPTAQSSKYSTLGKGAGVGVVGFGFNGNFSYGGIAGHMWGENATVSTLQPILFYNMPNVLGGTYVGYSNTWIYNWDADQWTIPLGAVVGKTFVTKGGNAIDFNIGAYRNVASGAANDEWQLKFGVSFFPG